MNSSTLAALPHDVLYELFLLCVRTNPDLSFPVVLSHVCHSWRATALASPIFWHAVVLRLSGPEQRHLRAKAFLERSQALPVFIHIDIFRHLTRPEADIILQHAAHVETFVLTSYETELALETVGYLAAMPFPSLEMFNVVVPGKLQFEVHRSAGRAPTSESPFQTPYPTPPALRSPSNRDFMWSRWSAHRVTSLTLKGLNSATRPSLKDMRQILDECKSTLRNLDFEGWAPPSDISTPVVSPVALPALRSLRLGYIDDMSRLVESITAPALQNLVLHDVVFLPVALPHLEDTPIVPCDLPRIFRALAPSIAHLRHLALIGLEVCARPAMDAFFQSMPALRVLALNRCHPSLPAALFQPEARYRAPQPVLPRLEHLSTTLVRSTDLARFLLRHRTLAGEGASGSVTVAPLRRLDITTRQFEAAYQRRGIRDILAVVLEMNSRDGMLVRLQNLVRDNSPIICQSEVSHG
ncbi:hypothetical protein C8R46DRAFT_1184706 [Mycena filopes]|nr:hypothetical protein C8R46DRAFT_1184706 [Mycena filopes]